jgi:MFS family permease
MTFYFAKFSGQLAQALLIAGLFVVAGQDSSAAVGLSGILFTGIAAALSCGFLAGALVDRAGPGRMYLVGAALRMLTALAALTLAHSLAAALVIAFAGSALVQAVGPAEMSLVRVLRPTRPARAHALLIFLQYGGQALGAAALAPALYFAGGTSLIFVGAIAASLLFLGTAYRLTRGLDRDRRVLPVRRSLAFKPTLDYLCRDGRARYALSALSLKTAVSRGVIVALPLYVHSDAGSGNLAIGVLVGVGAIGAVLGLLWSARNVSARSVNDTMRLAIAGMAVGVLALGTLDYGVQAVAIASQVGPIIRLEASLNTTLLLAMPAAFLLGVSFAGALIAARVALTASAPVADQGRIFATQAVVTEALLALPLLLTGLGVEFAGARMTLTALGIAALAVMVVLEIARGGERPELVAVPVPI